GTALRTLARRLIVQRKEGKRGDISSLNKYLHAYISAPHLERDGEGKFVLTRSACGEAIASCSDRLPRQWRSYWLKAISPSSSSASILTASYGSTTARKRTSVAGAAWPCAVTGTRRLS